MAVQIVKTDACQNPACHPKSYQRKVAKSREPYQSSQQEEQVMICPNSDSTQTICEAFGVLVIAPEFAWDSSSFQRILILC